MTSLASQDQQERPPGLHPSQFHWDQVFPICRKQLKAKQWEKIVNRLPQAPSLRSLLDYLAQENLGDENPEEMLPGFLSDLAQVEWALFSLRQSKQDLPSKTEKLTLNPTLKMIEVDWTHIPGLVDERQNSPSGTPQPGEDIVLAWRLPSKDNIQVRSATAEDLLVLKMVAEGIDAHTVADAGGLPLGAVDAALERAVDKGMILAPPSRIHRDTARYAVEEGEESPFVSASVFTLQWHITQACDLHCKHCYDRSSRSTVSLEQGIHILDDLRTFCRERHVRGQVSFTGGNPLLHPQFTELYRSAVDRGLAVAVLGNPTTKETMENLLAIERPVFFQVSLEGLEKYNDMIRGAGHFQNVMTFLGVLKDLGVPSKVMLTLTKGNLDQVLPLAERLRDLTTDFTFNRLSMVGEGANLELPDKEDYAAFLEAYMEASRQNPIMGWKDNLINIVCHQQGLKPFGGCTGYGCGAAFNFLAVLSDGEVHACRKFPSPIGNVYDQGIADIYASPLADRYRRGPQSCNTCSLRLVCRGCLAIAYSHGMDVFEEHDPFCFLPEKLACSN